MWFGVFGSVGDCGVFGYVAILIGSFVWDPDVVGSVC